MSAQPCDLRHVWFDVGHDTQCGVCGVWFSKERDRIALECERVGMFEAAGIVRISKPVKARKVA